MIISRIISTLGQHLYYCFFLFFFEKKIEMFLFLKFNCYFSRAIRCDTLLWSYRLCKNIGNLVWIFFDVKSMLFMVFAHIIFVRINFSRLFAKKMSEQFADIKNSTTFALAFGKQRGNAVYGSTMILETIPYRQAVQRSLFERLNKDKSVK